MLLAAHTMLPEDSNAVICIHGLGSYSVILMKSPFSHMPCACDHAGL